MTIKSSGPLNFSDIEAEFGGSRPLNLSDYYRANGIIVSPPTPTPTLTPTLTPASNSFILTITGTNANIVLDSYALSHGWNGTDSLTVINNGTICSNFTSSFALTTGTTYPSGSVITFINNGYIVGRGGDGGQGGGAGNGSGGNGGTGGPALNVAFAMTLTNNGTIGAGGGGGGGGGGMSSRGGGPGAGGGGGEGGSSGGNGGAANWTGAPGTSGGVGTLSTYGTGGNSGIKSGAGNLGNGGNGGSYGASGSNGIASGGGGGAGGKTGVAITGGSNISWIPSTSGKILGS